MSGENIPVGAYIDHINGNSLDNRRENLRIASASQNSQNRKPVGKSKYAGVCRYRDKWQAQIGFNSKKKHIGYFSTQIEAAKAYDTFVVHHRDMYSLGQNLNFPENLPQYEKTPLPAKRKQTSQYIGVCKTVVNMKGLVTYQAVVHHNCKSYRVAHTKNEQEAAKAYDAFVIRHQWDKRLNFPEDHPNYIPIKKIKTTIIDRSIGWVQISIRNNDTIKVLIDENDYDKIKHYPCYYTYDGYVRVSIEKGYMLHRYLLSETSRLVVVDHVNGNKLDNRRENIRRVTQQENAENTSKRKGASSKYYGVMATRYGTWTCRVFHKGKVLLQTTEKTEEGAAQKYDAFVRQNLPNCKKRLNFEIVNDSCNNCTSSSDRNYFPS